MHARGYASIFEFYRPNTNLCRERAGSSGAGACGHSRLTVADVFCSGSSYRLAGFFPRHSSLSLLPRHSFPRHLRLSRFIFASTIPCNFEPSTQIYKVCDTSPALKSSHGSRSPRARSNCFDSLAFTIPPLFPPRDSFACLLPNLMKPRPSALLDLGPIRGEVDFTQKSEVRMAKCEASQVTAPSMSLAIRLHSG